MFKDLNSYIPHCCPWICCHLIGYENCYIIFWKKQHIKVKLTAWKFFILLMFDSCKFCICFPYIFQNFHGNVVCCLLKFPMYCLMFLSDLNRNSRPRTMLTNTEIHSSINGSNLVSYQRSIIIVVCFIVRYFMFILVLQSSWWGKESWLFCLICLPGVLWWLSGSSSWCHGVVCGLWLWYFLIILTYYFFSNWLSFQIQLSSTNYKWIWQYNNIGLVIFVMFKKCNIQSLRHKIFVFM